MLSLRLFGTLACLAAASVCVSGCATSSVAHGNITGGTEAVASILPFTGPEAVYGPEGESGCFAAAAIINRSGGVMGKKINCVAVDTHGDPADTVPAVTKMLAQYPNLVMSLGAGTEANAVMPLIFAHHIVVFTESGDSRYDQNTSPYLYRLTPSDSLAAKVLALYAIQHGYKHAALVFSSDAETQTVADPLRTEYRKLGGSPAANITLTPDSSSYSTEADSVVAAKPDAILTELDAQTAATFFTAVFQASHGFPPIVTTAAATTQGYAGAVARAIGVSNYEKDVRSISTLPAQAGPGHAQYVRALSGLGSQIKSPSQYDDDIIAETNYDSVILTALAQDEAKSTNRAKWLPFIREIILPSPGATEVSTYAQAIQALRAGKKIHYVGASGPINLDKYNNTIDAFAVGRWNGHTIVTTGVIPVATIEGLLR